MTRQAIIKDCERLAGLSIVENDDGLVVTDGDLRCVVASTVPDKHLLHTIALAVEQVRSAAWANHVNTNAVVDGEALLVPPLTISWPAHVAYQPLDSERPGLYLSTDKVDRNGRIYITAEETIRRYKSLST